MRNILKKMRDKLTRPVQDEIEEIKKSIDGIGSLLSRQSAIHYSYDKHRIKVLFLVQSSEFWYALENVYLKMLSNDSFIPILFAIPSRYSENSEFENKSLNFLRSKYCSRVLHFEDIASIPDNIIEMLKPDVIFRQAPWEHLVPSIFRTEYLKKYRICYVPYALHTLNTETVFYNQELHNYAWRLYSDNQHLHECYERYNLTKDYNSIITGNTKFEYLNDKLNSNEHLAWPINIESRTPKLKILWCPHHSLETWLGFATFHKNYADILKFALDHPEYDIVFRPHPAMKTAMITNNKMTLDEYDGFFKDFAKLPNCHIDYDSEYIHLFHHSDMLVADGIAFLFEYLLTRKPIVRVDSQVSVGFNDYYARFQQAWYTANSIGELDNVILNIINGCDILINERHSLSLDLYDVASNISPSDKIIADLKESLLGT